MAEATGTAAQTTAAAAKEVAMASSGGIHLPWRQRPFPCALVLFTLTCIAILLTRITGWGDYVGRDNDDVMRLVEVRDLLAGQSWFDLMQYRLGPGPGTLMHWSRLIDLPIAALIGFFGLFLARETAEAVALAIWPMALVLPLYTAAAIGARRIGGLPAMYAALVFVVLLVFTTNRFLPGSIDHHNVQLVLAITIAAMLVDPLSRRSSYAVAGIAAALAIAIGAETMPFIAVCCLCVAVRWAVQGQRFAAAAGAFGLSLTLAISAVFFLTVPPDLWSTVTCDSLSLGFYGLASIGGSLLFLSATLASRVSMALRLSILAANGAAVLGSAVVLAPQCLGSPLAGLDPMLVELWLNGVSEAKSVFGVLRTQYESTGVFYMPGLLAICVCIWRVVRNDRRDVHAVLLALLVTCWGVALVQVRGAIFANLLSVLPLSVLVAELRARYNSDPRDAKAALRYAGLALASMPVGWLLVAVLLATDWRGLVTGASETAKEDDERICELPAAFTQLATLPAGLVVVPSDSGAELLRYTHHRTLTGPYHRNQAGMLTEIHIGISRPDEALAFVRDAGISAIGFCPTDEMTKRLMEVGPEGLYAALAKGMVPTWLEAMPADPSSGFTVYRVLPLR